MLCSKKITIITLISLIFNFTNVNHSHAVGGGIFNNILKLFGKNSDEAIEAVIKQGDEVLSGSKVKNIEIPSETLMHERSILNKVGVIRHQEYFKSIKKDSLTVIKLKHKAKSKKNIIKEITEEAVGNVDNVYDLFGGSNSKEQQRSYSYIIVNWVGKIYRSSSYFNKPKYEDRTLLACINREEIFYFTIVLDNKNDINRAFLTDHLYFGSTKKPLNKQELLIIKDETFVKIMSVKPTKDKLHPSNYFTIFDNQNFIHNINSKPEIIIKNSNLSSNYKIQKNKCYKVDIDGLILEKHD